MSGNFIIHTKTRNMSFLKIYRYLREKGIENDKFFLRLYDPDLQDVDPHSKRLTPLQQKKVLTEITKNPWYLLREVIRINIPGGRVMFELHPGNLAITWSIFNSLDFVCLLPRQRYKTVSIASALAWVYDFGTKNTHMLFGNKSLGDSKNNLRRLKEIRDNYPDYITAAVKNHKDIDNIENILSARRKNKIDIHGQPLNTTSADKMGRGMSIPIWWPDEFAFIAHNRDIYMAASPAINKVAELARLHNKPHGKMLSTTPSNIDTPSGAFCKDIIDRACEFTEEMYNWSPDKIREYIVANSSNDFIYIKYTWQMLGLSQEWYDTMCRELMHDWLIIRREVDLEWTKSSENSYFREEELDEMFSNVISTELTKTIEIARYRESLQEYVRTPYSFKLIEPLDKEKWYFIGVDVAGGLGKDFSTIVLTDPLNDCKPIGTFKNNIINTRHLSDLLIGLVTNYIPNSILFIENNSYGKAIIDNVLESDIADKVYFSYKVPDKDKTKNARTVTDTIQYGISTNTATRPLIVEIIKEVAMDQPELITMEDIYQDIKGLIVTKQGKVEHDTNMYDDTLMAWLMVLYAIRYSNNIAMYYNMVNASTRRKVDGLIALTSESNVNDPALDNGIQLDFEELVRLARSGQDINGIINRMANEVEKTKNKRAKRVNSELVNSLFDDQN